MRRQKFNKLNQSFKKQFPKVEYNFLNKEATAKLLLLLLLQARKQPDST